MNLLQTQLTRSWLAKCLLAATILPVAFAAAPRLANQPIDQLTSVEPNLLFVYDTSGSMAWTHVPDMVNSNTLASMTTPPNSVGYRNHLCNTLYYNPAAGEVSYSPPVNADGTSKANQAFTAAYYDGHRITRSSGTNTTTMPFSGYGVDMNLNSQFYAWDDNSVEQTVSANFNLANNPPGSNIYTESSTNALWTKTGSGPYSITIRTQDNTSVPFTTSDYVVVQTAAGIGDYLVTAVDNSGTSRSFTFQMPTDPGATPSSWTIHLATSPTGGTIFTNASANASWTRSGSGPYSVTVRTPNSTSHSFAVNDIVVVLQPTSMAGLYRVSSVVNSGTTRTFTFNVPAGITPPATGFTGRWQMFEATSNNRFYRINNASGSYAYVVHSSWFIHNTILGGKFDITASTPSGTAASGNGYTGAFTTDEKNWLDNGRGWIRIPMSSNAASGTVTSTVFTGRFTEEPGVGYYYEFTGAGSAPTGPSDVRCNEVPSSPRGNTTNFTYRSMATASAADQTRFANWFAFYRYRSLLMKTAVGQAFTNIDSSYRVGFMAIHATKSNLTGTDNSRWVPMGKFDNTQKTNWYSRLYASDDNQGGTPLPESLSAAGQYFANVLRKGEASPATYPDPMYTTDAGGSCQRNYTLLSTDGIWNTSSGSNNPLGCTGCTRDISNNAIGNLDGTSPPTAMAPFVNRSPNVVLDAFNASNTLADIALYYYATDIRSDLANNKKPDNNSPDTPFQNMMTYTVGLGLGGRMDFIDTYTQDSVSPTPKHSYQKVKEGLAECSASGWGSGGSTCNWPDPIANSGPERVDDLWHAAVNGRGTFFSAKNPQTLTQGFQTALQSIAANTVFATSPANVNPVLSDDDNLAYAAYFNSEIWSGRLDAVLVDKETGVALTDGMGNELPPIWKGHETLASQVTGTGWDTNRRIVVGKTSGTGAWPFRWASLEAAQQTILSDGVSVDFGQKLLNYIRGERANEAGCSPLTTCYGFRSRVDSDGNSGILGDIVNAIPVVVAKPNELYGDADNPGYSDFVTAKSSRTPTVYVVANDGMVHAFNGSSTGSGATRVASATSGREEWAYIPNILLRSTTDEDGYKNGLPSFAYNGSTTPTFHKHFFIDSNPFSADVDFNRTDVATGGTGGGTGSGDWRTILVGGLGKGGKGYFALDVTYGNVASDGVSALSETSAASKALWEFVGDSDMGFSYAEPFATRHQTYGWVVVVSSGYSNSTGNGAIWVLNAKTGQVIRKFSIQPSGCAPSSKNCLDLSLTPAISVTNPLNLGPVTGYVKSAASEQILALYAGDMRGNLWRMDLSAIDKNDWTIHRVASLTSPSGNGVYGTTEQPITSIPAITYDPKQDRRWIFVGTGLDLSRDDRDSTKDQSKQQQTMYGIVDGSGPTALPDSALPVTRSSLVSVDRNSTDTAVSISGKNGFYVDMAPPDTVTGVLAERIVFEPLAAFGVVAWATRIPTNDVCTPGFTGRLYIRTYVEGEIGKSRIINDEDGDSDGQPDGNTLASKVTKGPAPRIVILQTTDSTTGDKNKIIRVCDIEGKCETYDLNELPPTNRSRVGWRELLTED